METNNYTNVTIGWSTDLVCQDFSLIEAVSDCAKFFPGCKFTIIGNEKLHRSQYTADMILKESVIFNYYGLSIDPIIACNQLGRIHENRSDSDITILLTGQEMVPRLIGDSYEYHNENFAIISLKNSMGLFEIRSITATLLCHVMGHYYIDGGKYRHYHCSHDHCVMSDTDDLSRIKIFAAMRDSDFEFDTLFCDECGEALRKSLRWKEVCPASISCSF